MRVLFVKPSFPHFPTQELVANHASHTVTWAQRSSKDTPEKNILFLTINASELSPDTLKADLKSTSLSFSGTTKKGVNYAVDLEFYEEINVEESTRHFSPRALEFILRKKEAKAEYWPRLLKDTKKMHFLKTDFDKWVDQEEQEDTTDNMGLYEEGLDFSSLAASQGLSDVDGIPKGAGADSDDEDDDMPKLEGDDDMPELEGDPPADTATKDEPKEEAKEETKGEATEEAKEEETK
ncbi:HSP20-like chaperone [Kalaharituber pfeilii]|nr:HSP20-like chaperone [Kalaharituber pfeilii]